MDLNRFREQFVLVLGDMMVDKYLLGNVERISPEAPVPVLRQREVRQKLGGAGNVILNLICLGAGVRAVGRVGDDEGGRFFRETLRGFLIDDRYLFSEGNTIVKTRISSSGQQFMRIDEETVEAPSMRMIASIRDGLPDLFTGVTAVVLSDYAKGFITEELAQLVIREAKRRGIPVLADPKGTAAAKYRGATAITPNYKEFQVLTGGRDIPGEDGIREKGLRLCEENELEYLILTRSEKGITVLERAARRKTDYPAEEKEVIDVTGAGDTVVSVIALGLAAGFALEECVRLGNLAASIVISRFGAAQATLEELNAAQFVSAGCGHSVEETVARIHNLQEQGKRIVFTNGCFDLVHAGHIRSFRQARSMGDVLVVGVNSDESIRRMKGSTRPIVGLEHRIQLLSAIAYIDFVIPFEEDTPQRLIEQIRPDVLVKGRDWEGKEIAGSAFVRSYGGTVAFLDLEQGLSTTGIIEKIKRGTE